MDGQVTSYKVWVHIEGVNDEGDCIEGDSYHEPIEAGTRATLEEAQALRDRLLEAAGV